MSFLTGFVIPKAGGQSAFSFLPDFVGFSQNPLMVFDNLLTLPKESLLCHISITHHFDFISLEAK